MTWPLMTFSVFTHVAVEAQGPYVSGPRPECVRATGSCLYGAAGRGDTQKPNGTKAGPAEGYPRAWHQMDMYLEEVKSTWCELVPLLRLDLLQ